MWHEILQDDVAVQLMWVVILVASTAMLVGPLYLQQTVLASRSSTLEVFLKGGKGNSLGSNEDNSSNTRSHHVVYLFFIVESTSIVSVSCIVTSSVIILQEDSNASVNQSEFQDI